MKSFVALLLGLIALTNIPGEHARDFAQNSLVALEHETAWVDFELEDLSGAPRKLSDLKGHLIFLNFWATWCPPCRAEIPSMEQLYTTYKDAGLIIVAVNLREDKKTVQRFVTENEISFPVWLDTTGRIGGVYGARSIPTSYLIDRDGQVLGGAIGARDWNSATMLELFEKLLAAQ